MPPIMSDQFKVRWKLRRNALSTGSTLESCLERLECLKEDEHLFSSTEFVEGVPPFTCKFASQTHTDHLMAAADEDGRVVIFDTDFAGRRARIKEWSAHNNAIFDIAWSCTDSRLVTASGDQSAALWDVKTSTQLSSFKQHKCSLKSVSFRPWDGHVFATGARDGCIMIWDDRQSKKGKNSNHHTPVGIITEAHTVQGKKKAQPKRRRKFAPNLPAIDSSHSVSVVLFQKDDTLLSAGAADGIVKVWDLRKTKTSATMVPSPLHQFPYSGSSNRKRGFSSLVLSSTRTQLFAGCTDSVVYEYDLGGTLRPQPVNRYSGHMNSTFFIRAALSPDDLYLVSGSSDNHAYVWKVREPDRPPLILQGHEAEVTSVAWCPRDFTKIVTCSDDNTLRIWRLPRRCNADEELNQVVGRARRCEKVEALEGGESLELRNNSQSGSDSSRSTPTREMGPVPCSSQDSPIPSSTKKRKFSLKDWVTTSPRQSRSDSPLSPTKRRKSEGALLNRSEVAENTSEVDKRNSVSNKRKTHTCHGEEAAMSTPTCSKKLKVSEDFRTEAPTVELLLCQKEERASSHTSDEGTCSQNALHHGSNTNEPKTTSASELEKNGGENPKCDKENLPLKRPFKTDSPPRDLGDCTPCQRSPLKDDIPMNRAKSDAQAARKNIESRFHVHIDSRKGAKKNAKEKQQTLKTCFKDKKIATLIPTKRRNSNGTIDSYFQPLQKRQKSET